MWVKEQLLATMQVNSVDATTSRWLGKCMKVLEPVRVKRKQHHKKLRLVYMILNMSLHGRFEALQEE